MNPSNPVALCDVHEARAIVGGVGKTAFYAGVAAGRFPQPVRIGPGAVRWLRHELEDAIRTLAAARKPRKPFDMNTREVFKRFNRKAVTG